MGKDRIKPLVSRILDEDTTEIYLLPAESAFELENGDNTLLIEEEFVRHSIILPSATRRTAPTRLDFEARGSLQSLIDGDHPHTPILPLSEILVELKGYSLMTGKTILEAYEKIAFTESPQCVPCDTDYIGAFSTKLVLIDGVRPSQCPELFINEFGEYDDLTSDDGMDMLEHLVNQINDQSLESGDGDTIFEYIEPVTIRGRKILSSELIESYIAGVCYKYAIENLVVMIEFVDENKSRCEWDRICVDLLDETIECKEALSAIQQLADRASKRKPG